MTNDYEGPQFVQGGGRHVRYSSDFIYGSQTLGIQEALNDLPEPVAGYPMGKVIVDKFGEISAKIVLRGGQHLTGQGPSWRAGANPVTKLTLANGVNDDMIQITSNPGTINQYFPMVSWLHLDGNKANQTAGSCIHVDGQILDLYLIGVITSYAKLDGIHLDNASIKAWIKDCYAEYHDRNFLRITNAYMTFLQQFYTYDAGQQGVYILKGTTHMNDVMINEPRSNGIYYQSTTDQSLSMVNVNVWGCGALDGIDRYIMDAWNPSNLQAVNCKFGERNYSSVRNSKGIKLNGDSTCRNIQFTNCSFNALKTAPFELTSTFPVSELKVKNCNGESWKYKYFRKFYEPWTGHTIDTASKWRATQTGTGVAPAIAAAPSFQKMLMDIAAAGAGTSQLDMNGARPFDSQYGSHISADGYITDVSEADFYFGFYKDADEYSYFHVNGGDVYVKSNDGGVHGPYSVDTAVNLTDNQLFNMIVSLKKDSTPRFVLNGAIVGSPTTGCAPDSNAGVDPYVMLANKNNSAVQAYLYPLSARNVYGLY